MKKLRASEGFTLVETMVTTAVIAVVGIIVCSFVNVNAVLSAKNIAANTAHQQASTAMRQMVQDLRSAVSLPSLADASGNPYASPAPVKAEGISFQQWASGPHAIKQDALAGQSTVNIKVSTGSNAPAVGQHLIIPSHQIEADITAVSGPSNNLQLTLNNIYGPALTPALTYPTGTLPVAINGTTSGAGDVVCFVTIRCAYSIANGALNRRKQGTTVMANNVTNATPFSIPTTAAGALYYRFVAAVDLSTADSNYSNRGFKSANVLLNGQVPMKARLTTYQ
jgi:Tfp pilus assembly protein PilE